MKLDPKKSDYDQEFGWVANPQASPEYEPAMTLVNRRYEIEIIGGIVDEEASYSYDDWALCKLDNDYYLLSTSGCSCPSPSETWVVECGPATIDEIRTKINSGDYHGYTMPKRELAEFMALLDKAEKCSE